MSIETAFRKLINQQLSSVVFVQDYLQLYFDGPKLTLYIWPEVWINKEKFTKEDSQYRNMLCELISKKIDDISLKNDQYLLLYFQNKSNYIFINFSLCKKEIMYEMAIFEDELNDTIIIFD